MIPLYTSKQVRNADNYAVAELGMPGMLLMENAARSIYEKIELNFGNEIFFKRAGIVCGRGNNGGDGFALARNLIINGYTVNVVTTGSEKELKGDALLNFRILKNIAKTNKDLKLIPYRNKKSLSLLSECEIIVDALLGTGTIGELKEPFSSIIEFLNELNAIKIAVDIPTGLNADLSAGKTIFNADLTISLAELKEGLFYGKGYLNSGKVVKGSIGIGEEFFNAQPVNSYLIEPEDAYNCLPLKKLDAHKYSAGKVLVIAGSGEFSGAAFLTANSVMKSGAGAVTLAFPKSIKNNAMLKLQVPTVLPYEDDNEEFLSLRGIKDLHEKIKWADSIALGPGLGRNSKTFEAVVEILKKHKNKSFIIDADALYALGNGVYKSLNLSNSILTPHYKEFADLIGITVDELNGNLLSYGRSFSVNSKCILILKGAPTIIFTPAGDALINTTGNPGMAKFGSGDVLTGFLAGMTAQTKKTEEAAISAVYVHSLSADLLLEEKTVYGITSLDILENLPYAIKFVIDTFTQES